MAVSTASTPARVVELRPGGEDEQHDHAEGDGEEAQRLPLRPPEQPDQGDHPEDGEHGSDEQHQEGHIMTRTSSALFSLSAAPMASCGQPFATW